VAEQEVTEKIAGDVREGMEKTQREFLLRQQLAAIRKELGDDSPEGTDDYRTASRTPTWPTGHAGRVAVGQDSACEIGVGHGGAVVDAEHDGQPQRVPAADEGFVQDAVLPDPLRLDLVGQQPGEVVVADRPGAQRGDPGDQDVPVGGVRPGSQSELRLLLNTWRQQKVRPARRVGTTHRSRQQPWTRS
jgi:hypothetical protein